MRNFIFSIAFIIPCIVASQNFSENWEGHFSFLNVTSLTSSETAVYAAADNSVFKYDIVSQTVEEITTVNGLSGEDISSIIYSNSHNLLLIGYVNGLMEIVFDNDEDILTIVDIRDKPTIPDEKKIINHFYEYNDLIYVSTNFGITVYNLTNLEFGDTYYIGANGTQIKVNQTTVINNIIYAACEDNTGIKKASLANSNLVNFQEWTTVATGNWNYIQNINNNLYVFNTNRAYSIDTLDNINLLFTYPGNIHHVSSNNNYLATTLASRVYVYDSSFNTMATVNQSTEYPARYATAITFNDAVFIGTVNVETQGRTGFGVLQTTIANPTEFASIHPNGPLLNSPFFVETRNGRAWAVYGGYSITFSFSGGNPRTGISRYINNEWVNTPYDPIASVVSNPRYLSHVAVNPFDINNEYYSSYYTGLIETIDGEISTLYNQDNSTIGSFAANFHLATRSKFDDDGNLWVLNGRYNPPLSKFSNGNWTAFDFSSLITNPNSNLGFSDIEIDNSNNLYIGTYAFGVVGFNENGNQINNFFSEEHNMPSQYVTSLALDNRNQLWIGTFKGLRVLYNTSSLFEDNSATPQEIIILEDGVPKELLFQQIVSDIEVDGSNNKWIGTISSGLFYLSADGQETIFHFTKTNSPLPSNNIIDISIDSSNGSVFIATDKGLLEYRSGNSAPSNSLTNAFVYPNPVRPTFNIDNDKVKITGLTNSVNIKITDIEGNLVNEAQSNVNLRFKGYNLEIDGGTAYWNGKNLAGNTVRSGVYLAMISDLDTFETKVLKIMVVR